LALLYGDKNLKYNVNQLTQKFITEFVPTFALFNTDFKSTYYGNKFDIFVHFSNKKENPALDYFDGLKAKVEMEFSPILIEALEDTENNEIYFNQALYLANDMLKNADEYAEITKKPLKFSLKRENNEFKAF
jgi:hypothetical protein